MNENSPTTLETRARRLLDDSVGNIDMRIRSRLNQARNAALAQVRRPRAAFFGMPLATSAAGLCAASVLGVAIWIGMPSGERPMFASEAQASFEDLDILASTEESSGDNLEMLQDDADFYEWAADRSANPDGNDVG